jgi:mannose-6-phosphate isomerase-like protein (cupin superfamily)
MKPLFPMLVLLFIASTCVSTVAPDDFDLWKGNVVQGAGKRLSAKIDDQKFAWEPMGTYKNHLLGISHRQGDGSAELHENQVDIWIVEAGEATLIEGGKIADPKTVKPHEVRGTSIEGGTRRQLSAGDIVHINANIPHQLKIPKSFTYLVIKVDTE